MLLFFIYIHSPHKCVRVGWNNGLTSLTYTTGRRFWWMKRLCAINPPSVGQLDRSTRWVDEAVIIIWPALWHHPFTIYTCILALLVEKIFEVTPTSPKALTCWISQIFYIHFICIEYLRSVESENHIGPKTNIVALNRLFHGTLRLQDDTLEETGWKLVHGDVFRPPQRTKLLAALIGSGIQILCVAFVVIGENFFALVQFWLCMVKNLLISKKKQIHSCENISWLHVKWLGIFWLGWETSGNSTFILWVGELGCLT